MVEENKRLAAKLSSKKVGALRYSTPKLESFGSLSNLTQVTTGTIQEGGMMTGMTGNAGCMGQIAGVMERPCA